MPYRSSYESSFSAPTLTPWVKRLLIANTAVFVVITLLDKLAPLQAQLAMANLEVSSATVLTRPWTLVTYAFVHAGLGHIFFNMLSLFFFGPPLEERWGSREFIKFYAVAAAGGALLALAMPAPVIGASGAIFGILVAYAMIWPDNVVYFWGVLPIKVKWLVTIMVGFNLYAAVGGGGDIAYLAHLGGAAAAFAYLKSPWAPPAWGNVFTAKRQQKASSLVPWRPKAQEEVRKPVPVRATGTAGPVPADRARAERELLDDVDRILDKISTQGLQSLTPQEKERLNEVSRRYRTN
jgi:membrane associated rhomboid family serine protease